MAADVVFIDLVAILFIVILTAQASLFPPLTYPAFSRPARRKKEPSFNGWWSSEASTSQSEEMGVGFKFSITITSAHNPATSKFDSDPFFRFVFRKISTL